MTVTTAAFWAAGDYDRIARVILDLGTQLVDAAGVRADQRVLDVAAGTGNAAIPAAERGALVTALDITPELIETGRRHGAERGVDIDWQVGDAQQLPFEDDCFDTVLSAVGVMFAPDHRQAAAELARVCQPGGTLALANWTPDGAAGQMFALLGEHLNAPPVENPPVEWGMSDRVRDLLTPYCTGVRCTPRWIDARFDGPPRALIDHYRAHFAPVLLGFRQLAADPDAAAALDQALLGWAEALYGRPPGGRYRYEYLQTVADVAG